jgi:hypothetical protein
VDCEVGEQAPLPDLERRGQPEAERRSTPAAKLTQSRQGASSPSDNKESFFKQDKRDFSFCFEVFGRGWVRKVGDVNWVL